MFKKMIFEDITIGDYFMTYNAYGRVISVYKKIAVDAFIVVLSSFGTPSGKKYTIDDIKDSYNYVVFTEEDLVSFMEE